MSKKAKYYVYLHRKASNGEVFYVGMGNGRRAYRLKGQSRSEFWHNVAKRHGVKVEIYKKNLSLEEALSLEIELIAQYGHRKKGTGQLVNMTDGGDGFGVTTGQVNPRANLKVRTWININTGERVTGTWWDVSSSPKADGFTDYMAGKTFTTKTGWFHTDRFESIEAVEKAREAWKQSAIKVGRMQGKKQTGKNNVRARAVFCVEIGRKFDTATDAVNELNLSPTMKCKIGEVCRGARKSCGGYTWRFC